MDKITISDWLLILATLLSPFIAVQATRWLEQRSEVRGRKVAIFKTLMATRSYSISWVHVEALNRIDLEFGKRNKEEKAVVEAWKAYHDHLHSKPVNEQWSVKTIDLLVEMLHKMAIVLGYDFDKTHIKNSAYAPQRHSDTEAQWEAIRRGIIDVMSGDRPLPMVLTNLPNKDG
ncbi:DUF6680 family protein [Pseudomonas sp. O64]|uniref:DUF6680 family protein n=1 Tax=unclassified Pseudomonas TaxID=196821 RepID=UPI00387B4C3B